MKPEAPRLFEPDVAAELQVIHQRPHRTHDTAIYGTGDAGELSVEIDGTQTSFRIVPARCELELRQALAKGGAAPLALLVDYDTELPLDVQGRLAGGQVFFVDSSHRLSRLFGVAAASSELLTSPLARVLLEQPDVSTVRVPGPTLDLATAWRAFLKLRAGFPQDGAFSEDRVVAFCASAAGGPDFAKVLSRWPGLAEALYTHIEAASGPIARLAWESWQCGSGPVVAATAVLLAAAVDSIARDAYVHGRLATLIESVAPGLKGGRSTDLGFLHRWGGLAEAVIRRLDTEAPAQAEALIQAAHNLIPDAKVAAALSGSQFLPGAFEVAKESLAGVLNAAVGKPTREAVGKAREALHRLRQHRRADAQPHKELVGRAQMATRLLMYLLYRPDFETQAKGGASYEEMLLLAENYAHEGGFLDHARHASRGSGSDSLGAAINEVVRAIDTLRDRDDEHFVHGLKAWTAAGRKADRVVPADTALDRFATQFLRGADHRRLLIMLLDGMAWTNAVELLVHLEESHRFAPVRWRPKGFDLRHLLPPVLAAVPTMTNVSRSAIFAGQPMKPGEILDTTKDPDRFAQHRSLAKLSTGAPKLLLRSDAVTPAGHASAAALKLIASDDRVVAVVLNAIDDSLKVGPGMRIRFDLNTIMPLGDLLYGAADAGRAILLISDHGHVPGARMITSASASVGGATRWRPLSEGEEARAGEIVFEGDAAWHPKHKPRVAVLYRETDSYASTVHEGEHGGVSLAEVVSPAILIASDNLAARCAAEGHVDNEVEITAFPRPAWWDLELPTDPTKLAAAVAPSPKPSKPTAQIPMDFVQDKAPAAASPVAELLLASVVFKSLHGDLRRELREEIVPRVDALAGHGGQMPEEVFANSAGIAPWRVGGAVARMAELLNLDGYEVVAHDKAGRQVRLNLKLLEELFGGAQ
jgi:hypothetical protein